jgi:KaiC/GvpD/RAD55 family RecA-like ATPase
MEIRKGMSETPPLPIFRKDRISTGVRALDIMLEGGYAFPGAVGLVAPAGTGKQCFAAHFASAGLKEGDTVIYVTTDRSPDEVEQAAAEWDLHFKGKGEIFYIDCYSQGSGKKKIKEKKNVSLVGGPGAINEISLFISDILRSKKGGRFRVVFHSFSTFALYAEKEPLFKFLTTIERKFKNDNGTILLLVEEGMHEERFLMTLKHDLDEEYRIKSMGKDMTLESELLPLSVPIRVGPLGIEVD